MTLHVYDAAHDAPDRDAFVVQGRVLTWRQLAEKIGPVLNDLYLEGVLPGSREPYPLLATHDPLTILKLFALITAGVPVHPIHPGLSEAEQRALIDAMAPVPEPPPLAPDEPPLARGSLAFPDVDARDEHTLAVVYTSGSSGRPKGVILPRRAFVWSARASAANLGWHDDDRWLLRIPVAHVGGLSTVTRCLLARRCIVLSDGEIGLLEQIERDRVTIVSLVPTQLRRLLDSAPERRPPAHLRAVLLGGGAAPADLLAEAADAGWPVLTTYGLSECCSQVTTQRPGTVNRGELGSGPPLPGVELRIVDGVIQVRGRMLFNGYFPDDLEAPFTEDGWLITGDRGRLDDDGNLHVLGRVSDLIVSGGENVDPLEVENALRALDGIADACVFGVPDREWGERVEAAVVARAGTTLDRAAIDAALRQRLAGFKRPRALHVVEQIPLLPPGKPDRRGLARRFG